MERMQDWPVIYSYTRKQALADGVLVDVSRMARVCGFRIPVAMTAGAWAALTLPGDGRMLTVLAALSKLRASIARMGERDDRVTFQAWNPNEGRNENCWALCHGDDDGAPVVTFMLEGED